jgi:hypothetical protein
MHNAVIYSFHVNQKDLGLNLCYRQLMNSIESLRKYNKDIMVKVFISSDHEINIKSIGDNVEFIRFNNKYPSIFPKDWIDFGYAKFLYHRWINAFRSFELFNFDNILYLDTDTTFYGNPNILFNLYGSSESVWAMPDNVTEIIDKINLKGAMNDGQILISSKINKNSKKIISYMESYVCKIIEDTKYILTENEHKHLYWLSTQYAISSYFKENQNPVKYFDNKFVIIGDMDDDIDKTNLILHHYFSGNTQKYLPERFLK